MAGKIKEAINYVVWKTLPSCKDITALLSKSLDGNVSLKERLTIRIHLWTCIACQRYFSQIKFLGEVVEKQDACMQAEKNSPQLSAKAAERLKNAVKRANIR